MSGASSTGNGQKKDKKVMMSFEIPTDLKTKMDEHYGERKRSTWLRKVIEANLYSSKKKDESKIVMAHELNQGLEEGFDALKEELTSLITNKLDDYRRQWSVKWQCNECGKIMDRFSGSCPTYNDCTEVQVPKAEGPLMPALVVRSCDSRQEGV